MQPSAGCMLVCVSLQIGKSLGVADINPDVLGLLSHATQERLQDLLEKLTVIAQHHNVSYRVCVIQHAHELKHLTRSLL